MHLLLFEVTPFPERRNEYLDIAARLKAELERVGGCQHIERFRNLAHPEKLLSFQLWTDEAAIVAWRMNAAHQDVQIHGRDKVFEDYRLRVAEIAPPDGDARQQADAASRGRLVLVMQSGSSFLPPAQRDGLKAQSFASLYRADQYLHVVEAMPTQLDRLETLRMADPAHHHLARVTRDYGMFERGEAPQQRPPVCPHRRTT